MFLYRIIVAKCSKKRRIGYILPPCTSKPRLPLDHQKRDLCCMYQLFKLRILRSHLVARNLCGKYSVLRNSKLMFCFGTTKWQRKNGESTNHWEVRHPTKWRKLSPPKIRRISREFPIRLFGNK